MNATAGQGAGGKGQSRYTAIALAVLLAASLLLNLWNNGFSYTYHVDEMKKVGYILSGGQDFTHPILILQMVRLANAALRLQEQQEVAVLGRSIIAVLSTLIVLVSYLLARRTLGWKWSLAVAALVAVSPVMVVHAHYVKEDIPFTCFSLLTLYFLTGWIRRPSRALLWLLSLSAGLATSAQYKGLLLLLFCAAALAVPRGRSRSQVAGDIALLLLVAIAVFFAVDCQVRSRIAELSEGLGKQTRHVVEGHDDGVWIAPVSHLFGFHLVHSIVPGLTPLPAVLAAIGMVLVLLRRGGIPPTDRLVLGYTVLFYLAVEVVPLKPFPDFARYVIPIVPPILYFAGRGLAIAEAHLGSRLGKAMLALLVAAAVVLPLYDSAMLVHHLDKDTRDEARVWLKAAGLKAVCEYYGPLRHRARSVADCDIEREREKGVAFLVASSFTYDRYLYAATLRNQAEKVYERAGGYRKLFGYPFVEFAPAHRSFGFSNPTIRIIDIRGPRGAP